MTRYVTLVKYSPETLAAVREAGYASRVGVVRAAVESIGGTLESLDFMPSSSDYDFMVRIDVPSPEAGFAMGSMSWASGIASRMTTYEMYSGEAADAALGGSSIDYTPPGQ